MTERSEQDALLSIIRRLTARHVLGGELSRRETADLVVAVQLLDAHMTGGGAPPWAWTHRRSVETITSPLL